MLTSCRLISIALAASGFLHAQAPLPAFDVAEVKVHPPEVGGSSGELRHGQVRLINLSLRFLIGLAWDVPEEAVIGPAKIDGVSLDIVAKAASDKATDPELRAMLRQLLADRMKVVMHLEQKEQSVYALRVAPGGARLAKAEAPKVAEEENCAAETGAAPGHLRMHCTHASMREFISDLPTMAPRYVDKRVVDQTGLAGHYDFTFEWATLQEVQSGDGGLTLFAALQAQVGLKLESAKAMASMVVVESSARAPLEN